MIEQEEFEKWCEMKFGFRSHELSFLNVNGKDLKTVWQACAELKDKEIAKCIETIDSLKLENKRLNEKVETSIKFADDFYIRVRQLKDRIEWPTMSDPEDYDQY